MSGYRSGKGEVGMWLRVRGGTRTRSLYHVSDTMTVLVAWSLSLKCESHEGHESPFCLQRVTEGVAMGEGGHDCE